MYKVTSRKLEEFLHVHLIRWVSQDKDDFGETCWLYEDTDELRRVVHEYKTIVAKNRRLSNEALGGKVYRVSHGK